MRKLSIGAGTAVTSDMSAHKHELLMIIAAVIIVAAILLYNVFDQPKYSQVEPATSVSETVTAPSPDKVNINTASAEELTALYGIGEAKAKAIIAYREENGRFLSLDELIGVSGISREIAERNADKILF